MTKKRESNYEHNTLILKMIIETVILCVEQGLVLRGHRYHGKPASDEVDRNMRKVHQGNFLAIVKIFAKFDTILNFYNFYNFFLAEFFRDRIKEHISE